MTQQTASQGQTQSKPQRKSSALVAGLGAAFVASAICFTLLMSGGSPTPVATPDQAANTPSCKVVLREIIVSTTSGSGTVRLREGSYLSPPITLSAKPQSVVFPLARPETAGPEEVITVEGNATDVVLTSPVTTWRKVFDQVTGAAAFSTRWLPMKTC
jgi:hypothetical protein